MGSLESSSPSGPDVVARLGEGIDALGSRDLAARLGEVERTIRKLEAVAVAIVASADRRELFRADGHASVRGWVKATLRVADRTVTERVRTAKLCTVVGQVHDRLAAGELGIDQVRELARVYANPRCGDQLPEVIDRLLDLSAVAPHEGFVRAVRQ